MAATGGRWETVVKGSGRADDQPTSLAPPVVGTPLVESQTGDFGSPRPRKRLLVVAKAVPYPPGDGAAMRTWAVLRALAADGHSIELLSFGRVADLENAGGALRQVCASVEVIPHAAPNLSNAAGHLRLLGSLGSALPYSVARFRSETMRTRVEQWLETPKVDAVLCDNPFLFINLPPVVPVPIILNSHNIESLLLRRLLNFEHNPAKWAYASMELWKLSRWERRMASRASLILACSEHDRTIMATMCPETPVAVVPNIIDVENYTPSPDDDGETVLYVGAMDWYPNKDAASWFVSEIWPEVRRLLPGVRFRIAGRGPSGKLRRRLESVAGVEFTGAVPDMRIEIERAPVCVVPLRIASGTRLKILEAAALAKAIVSTRVGAEGLDFVDEKEIILADDPGRFAQAVADVVANSGRRRALGMAARRRVESQYSFHELRTAIHDALARLG